MSVQSDEPTNPPTSEILATHTLAIRTINQHKTALEIFDANELSLLRAWVSNNTRENRRAVLEQYDMLDAEGKELGSKAGQKGSLAGYVLARYGSPGDVGTLTDDEVQMLKVWFENGGGQ